MYTNIDRKQFNNILFKMSDENLFTHRYDLYNMYIQLEGLYWDGDKSNLRRHYYSDIFASLSFVVNERGINAITTISENMKRIWAGYVPKNKDANNNLIDISPVLDKLYDHINLDCARLIYSKNSEHKSNSSYVRTQEKYEELSKKYNSMTNKINNSQKEYIAILGIFAAVVLAFMSGIVFSTSVMENIYKASIYRTIIVSLLVSFFFFNLVLVLLDFIKKINGQKSNVNCICIIFNCIVVVLMVLTAVSYKYKWFTGEESITNSVIQSSEMQDKQVIETSEKTT